jgi:hypothetical protein
MKLATAATHEADWREQRERTAARYLEKPARAATLAQRPTPAQQTKLPSGRELGKLLKKYLQDREKGKR